MATEMGSGLISDCVVDADGCQQSSRNVYWSIAKVGTSRAQTSCAAYVIIGTPAVFPEAAGAFYVSSSFALYFNLVSIQVRPPRAASCRISREVLLNRAEAAAQSVNAAFCNCGVVRVIEPELQAGCC